MSKRAGMLCLVSLLLGSGSLLADVFWKVAAEAPRAPQINAILGDDRRILAVDQVGAWEFDGVRWVKMVLPVDDNGTIPGQLVLSGGRLFALQFSRYLPGLSLFLLDGPTWRPFAETKEVVASCQFGPDRLFIALAPFDDCHESGCDPSPSTWGRLISVSLVDGSVRSEPAFPACSGALFVLKGKLHLVARPAPCGGPSLATKRSSPNADGDTPLFRLDPAGWAQLPPVPAQVPPWSLHSTPSSIWSLQQTSDTESVVEVFDGERWSGPISLPAGYGEFVEWAGQLLWVPAALRPISRLAGNALVPFAPASPYRRPVRLFSAGSRLFAWSAGNPVNVLAGGTWMETSGIDEYPHGAVYVADDGKLFALMGGNVFEDDGGWKLLPPPGSSSAASGFMYQGRVGVTDVSSWPVFRLLLYSEGTSRWEDLGFPPTAALDDQNPKILQAGEDLFVADRIDEIYRLRQGRWSRIDGTRDDGSPLLRRLRVVSGSLFMMGDAKACRVEDDRLIPAFTDLPEGWKAWDVADVQGTTFLLAATPGLPPVRNRPLILEYTPGSWKAVVRSGDLGDTWLGSVEQMQLEALGGRLFVGWDSWWHWMEVSGGRLLALRGEQTLRTLSASARLGTTHDNSESYAPGVVMRPVERFRKTIPAIVDAQGLGGRYRSTVLLGNFSTGRAAKVRLYAGPDPSPCLELDLQPGTQTRLDDVAPGFVGPMTIDFDGLTEDRDGWAAVRIWNEADGGTAGVALEARDAGSFSMEQAMLVLPNPLSGTRSHLAMAVGSDGGRGSACCAYAYGPSRPEREWIRFDIPRGGFVQLDPDGAYTDAPLVIYSSQEVDDILPYAVRNDDRTQDGVVVQAEPRWTHPGRGSIFVPAAIAVSTAKGTFRTEMAIASAKIWADTPAALQFRGDSRGESVDATVHLTLPAAGLLRVEDVGSWLRSNGVPVEPTDFDGTILIGPDQEADVADLAGYVAVLGRGPSAGGDYSTSAPIFREAEWASSEAIVPGLLENAAFRSNLAVANPEASGGSAVTLSMTVHDDGGGAVGHLPSVTLQPGERRQINQILKAAGLVSSGWVEVRRISGSGRFVAYGVVNDNPTGDGTVFRMVRSR